VQNTSKKKNGDWKISREAERKMREEAEALRRAEEEGRRIARVKKIQEYMNNAYAYLDVKDYDGAFLEVNKVYILDPRHAEAKELEEKINEAKEIQAKQETRARGLESYKKTLHKLWSDGTLSEEDKKTLTSMRAEFDISEEQHQKLEQESKVTIYTQAMRAAWSDGSLSHEEIERLEELQERLDISAALQKEIERAVRKEFSKK
jgi:hypothetical protein